MQTRATEAGHQWLSAGTEYTVNTDRVTKFLVQLHSFFFFFLINIMMNLTTAKAERFTFSATTTTASVAERLRKSWFGECSNGAGNSPRSYISYIAKSSLDNSQPWINH